MKNITQSNKQVALGGRATQGSERPNVEKQDGGDETGVLVRARHGTTMKWSSPASAQMEDVDQAKEDENDGSLKG